MGLSAMVKSKTPGVVIAVDITLDSLNKTVSNYKISPHSEVILVDTTGKVLTYKNSEERVISKTDTPLKLTSLTQLNNPVLRYLGENFELKEQSLAFSFDHQDWIGQSIHVGRAGKNDVFAVMLSPLDELLLEASAIRTQSLMTTLGILFYKTCPSSQAIITKPWMARAIQNG